ncbi:thioester domain-containing protein [Streptomyces sp. JJ36]|uniref:thioester domain-containing protein n=1 Tax=Streptomyces sp. JJ36 TaxID=2736645 RepID=UPI001F3C1B01|nr:thioester domain-containing protein [Streptomyces sp. JJ36]MCF6525042.1 Cys-Gln thioester bond-forming surface protein [Streptomyces sp. JJ36]
MTSVRRRAVSRLAAAVLAPGLLAAGAIAGAAPAAADDQPGQPGGATATLDGLKTFDKAVIHSDGGDKRVGAGLFEMTVDGGGTLQTYCIDIANPTTDKARYGEVSWDESSLNDNKDAGKILWILQNSYPQVNDLNTLADAAKLGDGEKLTAQTAAAGTQVAIWRFSDHADVEAVDPAAEKLADYLEQKAEDVPEPTASLTLDPQAVSGKAGERLGPVTVGTNAPSVTVGALTGASASGVQVVDKDGNKLTSTTDGGELYFDVPKGTEPGSAALTLKASTKVPVGRAFTSLGGHKSQTQILAGSSQSTVSATATATWADGGPIAAVTAEKECTAGGVKVTVTNNGDAPFEFTLAGEKKTVPAMESTEVTVPVEEDQRYNITITGPDGFEKTISGVLDCETAGTGGGEDEGTTPQTGSDGGSGEDQPAEEQDESDTDLAATGSSSNTPLIVGIALALVVLGGVAMVIVRKRKPATASGSDD